MDWFTVILVLACGILAFALLQQSIWFFRKDERRNGGILHVIYTGGKPEIYLEAFIPPEELKQHEKLIFTVDATELVESDTQK